MQYAFKNRVCLTIFINGRFDISLNNTLSFHYTWLVNVYVNTDCMRCLQTKEVKNPQIFINMRIVLPWQQNGLFETRNLICLRACLCMQYCKSIIRFIFYILY